MSRLTNIVRGAIPLCALAVLPIGCAGGGSGTIPGTGAPPVSQAPGGAVATGGRTVTSGGTSSTNGGGGGAASGGGGAVSGGRGKATPVPTPTPVGLPPVAPPPVPTPVPPVATPLPPAPTPLPPLPASRLYIASSFGSVVNVYDATGANTSPVRTITQGINFPGSIYVDRSGTLYVPNVNTNSVTEYAAGQTTPSVTLTNGLFRPTRVIVGDNGMVYVANSQSATVGYIAVFARGATTPSIITASPPAGMTLDSSNNLYTSFDPRNAVGTIAVIAAGTSTGVDSGIRVQGNCNQGQAIGLAGNLQLDAAGNLIVGDTNCRNLVVYGHGVTAALPAGPAPISVFNLGGPALGSNTPSSAGAILDSTGTRLYDVTPGFPNLTNVSIYSYADGTPQGSFTIPGLAAPDSVVLFPAAPFGAPYQ